MIENTFSNKQKICFFWLSVFLIPLGGMSTDIYLPSLPPMSAFFHVDKDLVQLTVSAFVFAMGLGQLIAGPVSDALGRKKLIIISLLTQLLMVIGILLSPSIHLVIFLRFVQGLAVAFMMVPSRAVLNDIFTGDILKKKLGYITISFAVGPIIAPFIGGYLQYYFNWHANFYFIIAYILILMFFVVFVLSETKTKTTQFSVKHIAKNYATILENKYFMAISIFTGFMMAYSTLFNIVGPFIIQDILHKSPIVYGHLALLIGVAWFAGNMLNRVFFHTDRMFKAKLGLWVTFLAILTMLILASFGFLNIPTLIIPLFFIVIVNALNFGIYVAEGLSIFKDLAGSANACLFSIGWLVFGVVTIIGTQLKVHSLQPLAITFLVFNLLSIAIYYLLVHRMEKRSSKA